jgi:ABC-type transport system substrate-binding protein
MNTKNLIDSYFNNLLIHERKYTMKKTIVSAAIALLLLIILASTTFAAPAATEKLLTGSFEAVETHEFGPGIMFVDATGVGNATHLGLFTYDLQAEVSLPSLAASASATLIAANGDSIFGEGVGQGTPTGTPNIVSIVETYTITGGTGRFAGATGSFTVERLLDRATLVSSGTINGIILLP